MSLFRASNAPTDNRRDSGWRMPDGPTERLADAPRDEPPERKRRSGGVVVAVVFSMLALLISGGTAVLAWDALHLPAAPEPAVPETPGPVAKASPETNSEYRVSYAQELLRMQVGCAASMYLDLDEPRADADPVRSDLRYDSQCGGKIKPTLSLGPGADGGSQVASSDTDAAGCDRAIRTGPLGSGADVPAVVGTALCVLTSAAEARDRGDRPRMVLVEVVDVEVDGTAGLRATSWTVP